MGGGSRGGWRCLSMPFVEGLFIGDLIEFLFSAFMDEPAPFCGGARQEPHKMFLLFLSPCSIMMLGFLTPLDLSLFVKPWLFKCASLSIHRVRACRSMLCCLLRK